ncbi:MAG TPA: hypothetical protein VJN21_14850 [Candidatus Acidoferrales bacterium]|nr:hypothetical protein [Candidatus Acidoferrales bacterium]
MTRNRATLTHVPRGTRIFQRMFTRLGCQGRPPHFVVSFYPYAGLAHSIRLREQTAYVRLSDLLRGAAREVMEATAAILLARLYRRRAPRELAHFYREFAHAHGTRRKVRALRSKRARRTVTRFNGRHHDLGAIFDSLNCLHFAQSLTRPHLSWSARPWRTQLGAFDPALKQIAINCVLDRPDVPGYVVAYVLYHEMLHQKHPIRVARCRLQSHSRQFREEEKRFGDYDRAIDFLKKFS